MCYHVKFGSFATNGVRINIREPPKLGSGGARPLAGDVDDPLQIRASSTCVILPNLVVIGQTVRAPPEKFDPRTLSRSLEVIGTDTDRSATYDFLLTLHRKHEHIS